MGENGDYWPGQTLHQAAIFDNSELLQSLLEGSHSAEINATDMCGRTPVYTAVSNNSVQCLRILLQHGADLNIPAGERCGLMSPLHCALTDTKTEVVKILLDYNADLDVTDKTSLTPLSLARVIGHSHLTALIEDALSKFILRLCKLCEGESDTTEILSLLESSKQNLHSLITNTAGNSGLSPLCIACASGNVELVEMLLSHCAADGQLPRADVSPLHIACQKNQLAIVTALLQKFPMLCQIETADIMLPGHIVADNGSLDILTCLLEYPYPQSVLQKIDLRDAHCTYYTPFDLNAVNGDGRTMLYLASEKGHVNIVDYLLNFSVKAQKMNSEFRERSATSTDGSEETAIPDIWPVRVNLSAVNTFTPLHAAIKNSNKSVFEILLKNGADVNKVILENSRVSSALMMSCRKGSTGIVFTDRLLAHGAEDKDGKVLEMAFNHHPELLGFILKYKSIRDTVYSIDKKTLKDRYMEMQMADFIGDAGSETLRSGSMQYRHDLPVVPIYVQWQNLKFLTVIEKKWLVSLCYHHNPEINRFNDELVLFAITRLDVSNNSITIVPSEIFRLPSLCHLSLADNKITEFPKEKSWPNSLENLEHLELHHNKLSEIPSYVFNLPSLKVLNASHNQIKSLPPDIWSAAAMATIDVSYNCLDTLPQWSTVGGLGTKSYSGSSLCDMPNLPLRSEVFEPPSSEDQHSVSPQDKVSNVTMETSSYHDVMHVNYWTTNVEVVRTDPNTNAAQRGLKTLIASGNKITKIPKWLACCASQLETLNLSHNCLESVGNLSYMPLGLVNLNLSENKIASCDWLEEEDFEDSFEKICYRQVRRHSSCHSPLGRESVSRMPPVVGCSHRNYRQLHNLECLNLARNEIKKLIVAKPNEAGARMEDSISPMLDDQIESCLFFPNLKTLDVSSNKIEEIQPETGNMKELGVLTLSDNPLTELPPELGKLQLMRLDIDRCYIEGPIQDILRNSRNATRDIIGFLDSVLEETWDFGDKFKEYYATHQYFLSPRSLYLVVWKLTDGEPGIQNLFQWLVNIQARAPSAPVIIVGTHLDEFKRNKRLYGESFVTDKDNLIKSLYCQNDEPDKYGLPNVLGTINVSCSGRNGENIKKLVTLIYDSVFELRNPKKHMEKMLRHKIPRKYIVLKDIVLKLARERLQQKKAPVLSKDHFLLEVSQRMTEEANTMDGKCLPPFRNPDDIKQATHFLHEHGILFHYDEPNLRDLYFLDPQWLCDQLTQVVAVRQVNPIVQNGIMKIDHLKVLFKKSLFRTQSVDFQAYILSLLNKFELALQFDKDHLILPSLLPTEQQMPDFIHKKSDPRINLKPKGHLHVPEIIPQKPMEEGQSIFYVPLTPVSDNKLILLKKEASHNSLFSYCRLYLLTYFPSGFWPRLITRILADDTLYDIVLDLLRVPSKLLEACEALLESRPQWRCWQTGMELVFYDQVLFRIKEIIPDQNGMCNYSRSNMQCCMDGSWTEVSIDNSVILEMSFPTDVVTFHFGGQENPQLQAVLMCKQYRALRDNRYSASLLTKIVDHVDGLLQDWYPEIGESHFLQDVVGRYLITRLVPCPYCLKREIEQQKCKEDRISWEVVDKKDFGDSIKCGMDEEKREKKTSETDSAVPPDCVLYCFLLEGCIMNSLTEKTENCPVHKCVSPAFMTGEDGVNRTLYVAPDVVFSDLDRSLVVDQNDELQLTRKLGCGAFGEVYAGKRTRRGEEDINVAVKILYTPDKHAAKPTLCRLEGACSIYLITRQELSILMSIEHPHIVSLVGLGIKPLSLLLDLAPLGSLKSKLDDLYQKGQKLSVFVIKQIIIQVADALAYLHKKPIIHRDLKADNVLVWYLPLGEKTKPTDAVHIRLADYGISRSVTYSGAKGFCGTPPFIAPEILRQTGRMTYNEKVDIFSFGMFMYELLTCETPLEKITNLTTYVCQGGRPTITQKEECWPSNFLDIMAICWSQLPDERPSAETIQNIASCQEFCHLVDAISLETCVTIPAACSTYSTSDSSDLDEENGSSQVWLSTTTGITSSLEVYMFNRNFRCINKESIPRESRGYVLALAVVRSRIWCVDIKGILQIYRVRDQTLECEFPLDAESKLQVLSILHCERDQSPGGNGCKVAIIITSSPKSPGRSTLLYSVPQNITSQDILPEPIRINCNFCSAAYVKNDSGELWLGHNKGQISVYSIRGNVELATLEHFNIPNPHLDCKFLVTSTQEKKSTSVWSYNYPGSTVYRWSCEGRTIVDQIDCSRIVPKQESQLLSTEGLSKAKNYQVTTLTVADGYLYIGTTWGCIIVANAVSLTPYSVFRCHGEEDFRVILPLFRGEMLEWEESTTVDGIVTIGRGYREVFKELTTPKRNMPPKRTPSENDDVFAEDNRQQDPYTDNTYILSWSASDWKFY
ncbi:hypothetical protein ScPMuIL_003826 [Solemya velum]